MAKLLFSCSKDRSNHRIRNNVERLNEILCPDNLQPNPHLYLEQNGTELYMFNPSPENVPRGMSVVLGRTPDPDWDRVGKPMESGNFGIVREDEQFIELVADATGSRIIWWYHDSESFFAATSQRALLYCIPGFEVNQQTISWMVSTGNHGYGNAWDKRLKSVTPGAHVLLNRKTWEVTVKEHTPVFKTVRRTKKQMKKELLELLEQSMEGISSDNRKIMVPLSGGYDSRTIVNLLLKKIEKSRIQTITWGSKEFLSLPYSDSWVAAKFAKTIGIHHMFVPTENSDIPIATKFDRYLTCSEGRIDHIGAYWDGMDIWSKLFSMGIAKTIRGDECFGWLRFYSQRMIENYIFGKPFEDAQDLKAWGCEPRVLPPELKRERGESLPTWRDRMFQYYRIAIVQTALSDIKLTYVERDTPFLDNRIINFIRTIPDRNRTEKRLFVEIVKELSPPIPFARYNATNNTDDIISDEQTFRHIRSRLESIPRHPALPEKMLQDALKWTQVSGLTKSKPKKTLRNLIKPFIPNFLRQARNAFLPIQTSKSQLALRILIIVEMLHRLESDNKEKQNPKR